MAPPMLKRPTILAILALAALAAPHASAAQSRGPGAALLLHVRDEQGRPVSDAQVTVGGVLARGRSDATGEAFMTSIPPGNRLIELRRPGFAMVRFAADFAPADTVRRDVSLTVQAVEIEGITATSWGRSMLLRRNGFYDRQRAGMGAFMTAERVEHLHPLRSMDLFRYMRGFTVQVTRDGPVVIGTRGAALGNYCIPMVYLDGMVVSTGGGIRDQEAALDMVRPDDILAVEAYQGAASIPAEYNPTGSACGVILFWTRT